MSRILARPLLADKYLIFSHILIILGSFCAEDFLYLFDVQKVIGQYEF